MTILIADDDAVSRCLLEARLKRWGYDVVVTADGASAWRALERPDAPDLAVLDWLMPEMEGLEVCRRVRALDRTYLILLTVKGAKDDIVAGLRGGADDYVPKPFDWEELHARLQVGLRVHALQRKHAVQIRALQESRKRIKILQGLLPICGYCKKIRDDQNYWQHLEAFISSHSEAQFSHSICPDCYETVAKPQLGQPPSDIPIVPD
jgi:sigma-B regulation protein RsbU (phosphoserine phosphatase)